MPLRPTSPKEADSTDAVRVCIRVRPLSEQEKAMGEEAIVHRSASHEDTLIIAPPYREAASATFDWILAGDTSQAQVYEELGSRMVAGIADGFHGCALAYGQTSAGKSYTIFGGHGEDRGLLPRLTEGLFAELRHDSTEYLVTVSYLEVYNEKVRDLLTPGGASGTGSTNPSLEIRQHPKIGIFVEGLTQNVANTPDDVSRLIDFGHKIRVVGATNLNAASSRSHAVVTLHVERTFADPASRSGRRVRRAQLHAVDLAGSERLENIGGRAKAELRQKESKEINKSLLALSVMINKLAKRDETVKGSGSPTSAAAHIPYRNSKLTYLLSEALMGNCRTLLLACVSPAYSALGMTESTVQFASSAKSVRTRPIKNEDIDGCLVETLRGEIESLKEQLNQMGLNRKPDVMQQMVTAQLLHAQYSPTKEELQAQTQAFEHRRSLALENLGLNKQQLATVVARGELPTVREDADPFLVNVCSDPLLSGCLVYTLPGSKAVCIGSDPSCCIHVEGLGIQPRMCTLECTDGVVVELHPHSHEKEVEHEAEEPRSRRMTRRRSLFKGGVAQVFVNNELVRGFRTLEHKDRLRIGSAHLFQLFVPQDQEQDAHGVEEIVDKLALRSEGSQSNCLAHEYGTHLRERIGKERAISVFQALESVHALVDEANNITQELRGGGLTEMVFKAFVMTDVASIEQTPDISVSLFSQEVAQDAAAECVTERRRRCSSSFCCDRALRAIFTTEQFRLRLEALRDVYHEVAGRDEPWGLMGDLDPWSVHEGVPRLQTEVASLSDGGRRHCQFEPELPGARVMTSPNSGALSWEPDYEPSMSGDH